ncbi:methylenetetrahydrofolate reductase [NAD(P)H] [Marivirga sp. S37H4]|uniref:Methylenetetrahydrofolate reductase n=1 Tax=Marivirga aurantiaca TaxID=2802615 RepID=A0A934WZK0_9BACT|nr:methylenetetrahydrofolate reductase [NAD(P)H] [Marivirga aurantiaca]MBK6266118.1 methylenetetrahydrofolate reductase [NAD(P)H] [Marivirga aurantiaca]
MKVTEHINNAKKTLFSFEILPPLKGQNIETLFSNIEPLMEFKPPFIDVTYHREEYVYHDKGNGLLEKRTTRKRPGTVGICAAIKNRFDIDTVPHIICGGFSKEETENALIDLDFLGIDSVLILRGDPIKSESKFIPDPNGHTYAIELLEQVVQMNQGKYLDEDLKDASHSNFCMGVAGYPEKHFEAPSMKSDIKILKKKVEAGAEYVVTQMFFDNQKYFEFVETCRKEGINVPIIPGLKPITSLRQMSALPRTFFLDLPDALVDELEKCKTNEAAKEVGIDWCVQQSKELIEFGTPCLHYYSMGKSDPIYRIAERVF